MASLASNTTGLPAIVIVGATNTGKKTLAEGLHKCCAGSDDERREIIRTETLENGGICDVSVLNIATKYYTADVELWVLRNGESEVSGGSRELKLPSSCEALVASFSAESPQQTMGLAKASLLAGKDEGSDVGCRLLVCGFADCPSATSAKDFESAKSWCFDQLIEYVDGNFLKPLDTHSDRDKVGVARVYECLQTVMWSNLNQSNGVTKVQVSTAVPPVSIAPTPAPNACASCGISKKLKTCSSCGNVSYCSKDCQKQDWVFHKEVCKAGRKRTVTSTASAAVLEGTSTVSGDGDEKERVDMGTLFSDLIKTGDDAEELYDLIAKAKLIREGSVHGTLSDEERFREAEKTAIRLAELFGLDDDDNKAEEEETP